MSSNKLILRVWGSGYIPDFYACNCGSVTYAYLQKNNTILCGACGKIHQAERFTIRYETNDKDAQFWDSVMN